MTQHYEVKDGVRTHKFDGTLLAQSSSRFGNRPRWVEFRLYRTPKGTFVLSRVGVSIYYHSAECSVVFRNKLAAVDEIEVPDEYLPCSECRPSRVNPDGIFPETPRYWALSTDRAKDIITHLMKYDDTGVAYLTNVASRLLIAASKQDKRIHEAFYVNLIE